MNPTALKFIEALKMQNRNWTQDESSISSDGLKLIVYPSLKAGTVEKIKLEFYPLDTHTENALYPTLLISDLAGIKINFISIYEEFKKNLGYSGLAGDWNLEISAQGDLFCMEMY